MDELDRKIIRLLAKNARIPVKDIAQEINLTSPAVSSRIRKLEQDGIIGGYTVVLHPPEGRSRVEAFISLALGPTQHDDLMTLYGKSDFLLIARARNVVTLSNFPSKVPEMMSYGVVPVCSDVGDYTEIYLRDGIDSIQFENDSVSSCADAICRAIEIKESSNLAKMQEAARETVKEKLDYWNWGGRIVAFLQE